MVKKVFEELGEVVKETASEAVKLPKEIAKESVEQTIGPQKTLTEEDLKNKEEERQREIARVQRNLQLMKQSERELEKPPETHLSSPTPTNLEKKPNDLPIIVKQKQKSREAKDIGKG